MPSRWVKHNLSVQLPVVAQSIVAMWWPGRYYWVSTVKLDRDSPLAKFTANFKARTDSRVPREKEFVTQVFKCNKHGVVKSLWELSLDSPEYEQTYDDLDAAKVGHKEVVRLVESGLIRRQAP